MDVTNTTGNDTDYKVSSGGGTRGSGGWRSLPRRSRVQHQVTADEGPWKIEFRVASNVGTHVVVGSFCRDPEAKVVLVEREGSYGIAVNSEGS
ncbi:MAG TPA: hypothetical protein VMW27_30335 [Thermoanaerobaculia bacterium]|nr:hypothetical protein [Thermoanaerobaculia bacterium]